MVTASFVERRGRTILYDVSLTGRPIPRDLQPLDPNLLYGISLFSGLDLNGHHKPISAALELAYRTIDRIGTALMLDHEGLGSIVGKKRLHYLTGLTAAVIAGPAQHLYLQIIGEPCRKRLSIPSLEIFGDRIEDIRRRHILSLCHPGHKHHREYYRQISFHNVHAVHCKNQAR